MRSNHSTTSVSDPSRATPRIGWIFFDCFNTLLAEPRSDERFPYLTPLADLPVRSGLYGSRTEFLADYARWYDSRWPEADSTSDPDREWVEVPLAVRLTELIRERRDRTASGINRSRGASDSDADEIVSQMILQLGDHYLRRLTPTDGVRDMLFGLCGRVKMAVVSNFYIAGWPALALDHFGLRQQFSFVLDSAAFGVKKPGAAIYEEALRRAAVSARNVLFVGDSLANDVLTPRRLGMRALHYRPAPSNATAGPGVAAAAEGEISHWRDLETVLSPGT